MHESLNGNRIESYCTLLKMNALHQNCKKYDTVENLEYVDEKDKYAI